MRIHRHSRPRLALSLVCAALAVASATACETRATISPTQRVAIADTLKRLITNAYDLSGTPGSDPVKRLMSLYPDSGAVVSAAGGRLTTTRSGLERELRTFYDNVGRNMRDPKWVWGDTHVDVLSPDAAVLTATYSIPHRTPAGHPHTVGGAWTAVFERRNRRWVIVQEHLSDAPPQ
jgi:ketosteroid isomerase-like protein